MKRSRLDALIMAQEHRKELTRDDLEAIQLDRLNRLLLREKERGGFYAGLPARLDSLAQLAELPFTTDEDLAHHAPGLLLCSQSEIQRVLSDATSGTTGAPKRVYYTREDCERTVELYVAGLSELIGPGGVTMICFPFSGPFGLGELIAEAVRRLGAKPLRLGPALSYGAYREAMERERPDSFVGMPVQLLSILRVCGRGSLRRALVSGDACPDSVICGCEEILGSRLFPHYGSREMGMAGAICCPAHEGMHLRENHVIAEIVGEDGRVLPPGEFGELVITTPGMEAMPLIRYRTGDYTRILPEPCPCGSVTLRLDRLLRKEHGLSAAALDEGLFSCPKLADCSYAWDGDVLRIEAKTVGAPDRDELERLAEGVRRGGKIRIAASEVREEDIPCPGGKRSIRGEVRPPENKTR